ncbi:hypothetical protein EON64_14315 [archaeon]|nr:MAG: hypothetical protein EON64_14315 [archaeon]
MSSVSNDSAQDNDSPESADIRRGQKRPYAAADGEGLRKDTYYYRQKMKAPSFPRIMKHDIRREYAGLLLKAVNSSDLGSILRFMEQHCVPHCVLTDHIRQNLCQGAVSYVKGAEHIGRLLFRSVEVFPDMVCRAQGSHIVRRSHEDRSDVIIHAVVQGNRVSGSKLIDSAVVAASKTSMALLSLVLMPILIGFWR